MRKMSCQLPSVIPLQGYLAVKQGCVESRPHAYVAALCQSDTSAGCSPLAEQSASHGAASPLAAGFSPAAAGAVLPVQPADVLQQGAEHGTGGHPVGVVPEEGLRDCESTCCSAFSYTASQCLVFLLHG